MSEPSITEQSATTDDDGSEPASGDADQPPDERPIEVVGSPPVDAAWIRDRLEQAATLIERPIARVAVAIVGDERMRELHERHHDDPDTTDVLTFQHSDAGEPVEADIVVCVDEARRRIGGRVGAGGPEPELLLYALHGVLHCVGFDDHDPDGYETMHAEEDRILEAIGVGRVFSREVDDG